MLYVKNTGPKVMGFGSLILVQGQSEKLPEGFNEKHPIIRFYIEKGWLTVLDAKAEAEKAAKKAKDEADRLAAEKAVADSTVEEATRIAEEESTRQEAESKAADTAAKIKALSTMNLDPLRALAKELGIGVEADDTKDALKKKITEKYQSE